MQKPPEGLFPDLREVTPASGKGFLSWEQYFKPPDPAGLPGEAAAAVEPDAERVRIEQAAGPVNPVPWRRGIERDQGFLLEEESAILFFSDPERASLGRIIRIGRSAGEKNVSAVERNDIKMPDDNVPGIVDGNEA